MYLPQFEALTAHADRVLENEQPAAQLAPLSVAGITLDASRQWLDAPALEALNDLAGATLWESWRIALEEGEIVNPTEAQGATHFASRAAILQGLGEGFADENAMWYEAVYQRVLPAISWAQAFFKGELLGATGKPLKTLINLGIGGSDLGPRAVVHALAHTNPQGAARVRFVANIDPQDFIAQTRDLDPETTAFCVSSKSFGTLETLANARFAKAWLEAALPNTSLDNHFVAVSSKPEKVKEVLGIGEQRVFAMEPTVGGRYSLWSAIGLPIVAAFGLDAFKALSGGAVAMDRHFFEASFAENLPARLGMLEVWNATCVGMRTKAVISYSEALSLVPQHLQQLEMESLGKRVDRTGAPLDYETGAALLAGVGTQAQHAFFQWLHQGTTPAAHVFLTIEKAPYNNALYDQAHADLNRCAIAQANVLWQGGLFEKDGLGGEHGLYLGGRPVSFVTLSELNPQTLGALIAAFEHATFTAAVLWGINAFDQWGVELGKRLGNG